MGNRLWGAEIPIEAMTIAILIANRRRDAAEAFDVLAVVGRVAASADAAADARELGERRRSPPRVGVQLRAAEEGFDVGAVVVGEERATVSGGVERDVLAGLPGHRQDLPGGDVAVDEERHAAIPDREMGGFARRVSERAQVLAAEGDQHVAAVLARQPPDRRSEDVLLPAVRIGEESPLAQRVGEAKDAAAVDAEKRRSAA